MTLTVDLVWSDKVSRVSVLNNLTGTSTAGSEGGVPTLSLPVIRAPYITLPRLIFIVSQFLTM